MKYFILLEIKMAIIETKIDNAAQKALSKKTMITYLVMLIIGSIGLFSYMVFASIYINKYLYILLIFAIPFSIGFVCYITLNSSIKDISKCQFTNKYEFDKNFFNVITIKEGNEIGKQKINYKDIYKVKETKEYIFIYINKLDAYIIKKSNTDNNTIINIKILINSNFINNNKSLFYQICYKH